MLMWLLSLWQGLLHAPLLHHDPYAVDLAFNWGGLVSAAVSLVGSYLQKKGKDKQADAAGKALASSNEARQQALGQLSNESINAILGQFFPGLNGSAFGGSSSAPRGAVGASGALSPWSAALQDSMSKTAGSGGPRAGTGFSPGGAEGMAARSPNVDRGAFADTENGYPQYVESHPGAGQEATERGKKAFDWMLKNIVGVAGVPALGGKYAMPGGGPGGDSAGTGTNPGPKSHAYADGDVTRAGKPANFWGPDDRSDAGRRNASQAFFDAMPNLQGGGCFHGDTRVVTPNGSKAVRDLNSGDLVLGGDGKVVAVTLTREHSVQTLFRLNSSLRVTGEHPFAVLPGEVPYVWKPAAQLRVNDELVGMELLGRIHSIGTEVYPDGVLVYNPEVEEPHTYFVLLNGIPVLVHNKTEQTGLGNLKPSVRGFAAGGNPLPGERVTVGEQGPEQVILPAGGTVVPNPTTAAAGAVAATLPGNRTPTTSITTTPPIGAPPPGPNGVDVGTPPPARRTTPPPPKGAGDLVSESIRDFLANPGQTSTAGYERDVANSNQALNAARMGISGELTGAGVDPSSGAGQFLLSNAVGQAHRSRNEASNNQAQREEQLRREDLDRGIKDYMAALQMSFNLAAAKSAAIAGVAFPQVAPIDTYQGIASGVGSLGYFLGQALQTNTGTTSTSSRARGTGGDAAMNGD